ncbi:hypothetical protein CYLTODRAFT_274193 [Cylindrobasidium torrendii FP15055 ss-10]|uniref:F-box domain-containing protein n=1 Tax=Cylindrobasidium torrendii FP15055 ss-10 TaxID=1314674 RepID=A0A0D7BCZ5_9AGAR|nr:hypothetical protein CYLTODRAFT_274193 [Cylindrobasidium torrendii FP15055 ss-10]
MTQVILCCDCNKVCVLPDPKLKEGILSLTRAGYQLSATASVVEDQLSELDAQVLEYEHELRHLDNQQETLDAALRSTNLTIQAYESVAFAPIRKIPDAILLYIFFLACASVDETLFPVPDNLYLTPFYISSVCAHWMTLTRSSYHPELWWRLADGCIPRLSLSRETTGEDTYTSQWVFRHRLPVMYPQSGWKTPYLYVSLVRGVNPHNSKTPRIVGSFDGYDSVTSLALDNHDMTIPRTVASSLSFHGLSIWHLYLRNIDAIDSIDFNYDLLKSVWLDSYHGTSTVRHMLDRFNKRISLTLHRCDLELVEEYVWTTTSNITSLHISEWLDAASVATLFSMYFFPHLTTLVFTGSPTELALPRGAVRQCPLLEDLKLKDVSLSDDDVLDILYDAGRLHSLSIIEPTVTDSTEIWYPTITRRFLKEMEVGRDTLLPRLKSLELVWDDQDGPVQADALLGMLQMRAGPLTRLVIGARSGAIVEDRIVGALSALRETGVDAMIW